MHLAKTFSFTSSLLNTQPQDRQAQWWLVPFDTLSPSSAADVK